ncbi:MAG: ester cyclase, partial [Vicinamibacterales bacterium]
MTDWERQMDNIASVRRYFKAWIDRDADAILASLVDGGTYQDPSTIVPISGETLRAYVNGLWQAFPDLTFEEESIGETGPNRVAAQWSMRGTNTGSMMGLPPTGKAVSLHGADFFTLKDGKVETVVGYFDKGELPRQIGLDVIVQPAQIGP